MNTSTIQKAQAFLTVRRDQGDERVLNIEHIMKDQSVRNAVLHMSDLYKDHEKKLQGLVLTDITSPKIDELISRMFRIKMAISTIKDDWKEVRSA